MVTKSGQFTKLRLFSTFQLFKLYKLFYQFVAFWKGKYFFDIPSYPCPSRSGIHWPINFIFKKWCFCIFSKKKKSDKFFRDPSLHFSFAPLFFKYTETSIFLVKLIGLWIPDGDWRRIARDIKKNIFIFKTRQEMITKLGQFKKLKCREESQLCKLSQLFF